MKATVTSDYKKGHRINGFDRAAFAATVRTSRALAATVPEGLRHFREGYMAHRPKPWRDPA